MADDTNKLLELLDELESRALASAYAMFDHEELNTLLAASGRTEDRAYRVGWYIVSSLVVKLVPEARLRLQLIAHPENYRNVLLFKPKK